MRVLASLLVALFCAANASAQTHPGTLYSLDFVGPQVAVYAVNPATGARTLIVTTDAVTVSDTPLTFDPAGRRLFFSTGSDVYVVHVDTGTYSHVAAQGAGLDFDPVTGRLITLSLTGGVATIYSVDLATGASSVVAVTDAVSVSSVGPVDPARRRYFFRSGLEIYVVNIDTGTFTHFTAPGYELEFDPISGELYSLDFAGSFVAVIAINPATGATRQVAVTDALTLDGTSAFDPITRRFFFRSAAELYTVNVDTGAFSHVTSTGFGLVFAASHFNVPTLSTTMLIAMALALTTFAFTKLR